MCSFFLLDRQGQMWVHGWAAKETNLYEVLLHSGIQHDNRSLDRVTMVYCNKRNYKNATKICNPHPGLPSGERRQSGMLLLGVRGQKKKSVFLGPMTAVHECQRSANADESLFSVEFGQLKTIISLILIKNSPGFGLTNKSFYL